MKLWIDDVRRAPEGYVWAKSVNEAKEYIESAERNVEHYILSEMKQSSIDNRLYHETKIKVRTVNIIDIDHDAGEYANDGGDYIKLLDWLEETGRNYPIRIHSMNPVGIQNMRAIIEKNGWQEIK